MWWCPEPVKWQQNPEAKSERTGGLISWRTRSQHGISHAVDDFFVGRNDGRQHAAKLRPGGIAIARNKVIGTEPRAPFYRHEFVLIKIKPCGVHERRLVETLQHVW